LTAQGFFQLLKKLYNKLGKVKEYDEVATTKKIRNAKSSKTVKNDCTGFLVLIREYNKVGQGYST